MYKSKILFALFLFVQTTTGSEIPGKDKKKSENTPKFLLKNEHEDNEYIIISKEEAALKDNYVSLVPFGNEEFSKKDGRILQNQITKWRKTILRQTNVQRKKRGLKILRLNPKATTTAQNWALTMSKKRVLAHNRNFSSGCSRGSASAENVAYNTSNRNISNPKKLVTQWMNSSGHRANILNRKFSVIGIGIVEKKGIFWGVQVFCSNK